MSKTPPAPKTGDLRIWWIQPVPGQPFQHPVKSLDEAKIVYQALAAYDIFKDVSCNAGGLEVFEDGEWSEWMDEHTGDDLSEVLRTDDA